MINFIGRVVLAAIFVLSLSSFKNAPNENNLSQIVMSCHTYASQSTMAEYLTFGFENMDDVNEAYSWYYNVCNAAGGKTRNLRSFYGGLN